jgi:phosphohistidine swiveling domain-containing protein
VYVVSLEEPDALDAALCGGKGSSLGRLVQSGFPVPPGFCVTTRAYSAVVSDGLGADIDALVRGLGGSGDVDETDRLTSDLRTRITDAPIPPVVEAAIASAYQELGTDVLVAVRSSGTAEDLATASFAGLHDTYLDISGTSELLAAVRRCWASMWTTRATSYRHAQGFDHSAARLAVVVQRMLSPRAAGVLFTANPFTGATDEMVVNANWGLGESVVSGLVTPDQYVVAAATGAIIERSLGSKELRIDRDRVTGHGTISRETTAAERDSFALSESDLIALADTGRRLQRTHEGLPLDIEWATEGHSLHVLQARHITGVEFSWDADLERWQAVPEDPQTVWTRGMSDEGWTGAKTPLMYSWRANSWTRSVARAARLWGVPEIAAMRCWKFHRGEAYFNCQLERLTAERTFPRSLRPPQLPRLPADWQPDVKSPSMFEWIRIYVRMQLFDRKLGPVCWFRRIERDWIEQGADAMPDASDAQLQSFTDAELFGHIADVSEYERHYCDEIYVPFFLYARDALSALPIFVLRWFGSDEPTVVMDLLTGTSQPTITQRENHSLWLLAQRIRNSTVLRKRFDSLSPTAFFDRLEDSDDGRAFRAEYERFLSWSGHRGHSDRDLIFPRRCEDPTLDASAFRAMLTVDDPEDPTAREDRLRRNREATIDRVLGRVRKQPFGRLKAPVLRYLIGYADRFLMVRDNERHFVDRTTFATRRAYLEVGRRLVERGLINDRDDVFFLGADELDDLFAAGHATVLTNRKIAARKRDFERVDRKQVMPPPYLVRGVGADLDGEVTEGLHGTGTSRGSAAGTARVIRELKDIGLVRSGDVLVCNSTDPGWTPVFSVISGIVLETGGMLAHASCLAREYGLPAVQLPGALGRIPDGALITVDGDTGTVTLHSDCEDPGTGTDTSVVSAQTGAPYQ